MKTTEEEERHTYGCLEDEDRSCSALTNMPGPTATGREKKTLCCIEDTN